MRVVHSSDDTTIAQEELVACGFADLEALYGTVVRCGQGWRGKAGGRRVVPADDVFIW